MHVSTKIVATLGLSAAKFLSCPSWSGYNLTSSSLTEMKGSSNTTSTLFCYYDMGHTCGYNAMTGDILSGATGGCPGPLAKKADCYTTCAVSKDSKAGISSVTVASNGQTACSLTSNSEAQCIYNTTSGAFVEVRYGPSNTSTICQDVKVEKGTCAL